MWRVKNEINIGKKASSLSSDLSTKCVMLLNLVVCFPKILLAVAAELLQF